MLAVWMLSVSKVSHLGYYTDIKIYFIYLCLFITTLFAKV